jgi:hypothetical protein
MSRRRASLEAVLSIRIDAELERRIETVASELSHGPLPIKVTTSQAARVLLELGVEAHAARLSDVVIQASRRRAARPR